MNLNLTDTPQPSMDVERPSTKVETERDDVASDPARSQEKVHLLSLSLDNLSAAELLEQLTEGVCFTPNVDHLIKLERDPHFREVYEQADYIVCDSQILYYASKLLGNPIKEKIAGSDFFPAFYQYHRANSDISIYLLGGDESALPAKEKINAEVGRQIIVGANSPSFGFENNEHECLQIIQEINRIKPTVLAVGVGAPKQEKWIVKYRHMMPSVKIFLAIGATIDFEGGKTSRAPKWMSRLGFEWLYRVACEPKRLWHRYFVEDLPIIWLLLKQRFGLYTAPFSSKS